MYLLKSYPSLIPPNPNINNTNNNHHLLLLLPPLTRAKKGKFSRASNKKATIKIATTDTISTRSIPI